MFVVLCHKRQLHYTSLPSQWLIIIIIHCLDGGSTAKQSLYIVYEFYERPLIKNWPLFIKRLIMLKNIITSNICTVSEAGVELLSMRSWCLEKDNAARALQGKVQIIWLRHLAQSRLPKKTLGPSVIYPMPTGRTMEVPKPPPTYQPRPSERSWTEKVRRNTYCACAEVIWTFTMNGVSLSWRLFGDILSRMT